jgi:hypothetical protein
VASFSLRAVPVVWNVMKPLLFLANAFINTFGITQPSAAAADRAAKFIATLIGLVILLVFGVGVTALYLLARH